MGRRRRKEQKPRKGGYLYRVMKAVQGGRTDRMMKDAEFTSKKEAERFYRGHPRATRIQQISKSGLTAGSYQPDVPQTIKHKGKNLRRTYAGPHDKRTAQKLANSLRSDGWTVKIRTTKRGRFIYAI